MKSVKIFFLVGCTVIISQLSIGQNHIYQDSIRNRGIYKRVDEFRYNKPSIELTDEVIYESDYRIRTARIKIKWKKASEIGNVFGFCDGDNIFVNIKSPRLRRTVSFNKIEAIGKICYFEVKAHIQGSGPNGSHGTSVDYRYFNYIVNTENGEIVKVKKKNIGEIIGDDGELLKEFNNEKRKKTKVKKYILQYIERKNAIDRKY